MTSLTDSDKLDIMLSVMLLFCADSEKRDTNNIISDAVLKLHGKGRPNMTPEKAEQFFLFLEGEMRKHCPEFEWPDQERRSV